MMYIPGLPLPTKTPKTPINKTPDTRLHDIFIFSSFSIYIRIQKKNRYTLKNRKNRVNDVSTLIVNHLDRQNRVKIAYP